MNQEICLDELTDIINNSLKKFYENDIELLNNIKSNSIVDEACASHRIAKYLEDEILEKRYSYNVDCEYNKYKYDAKKMHEIIDVKRNRTGKVRPDILIHRRRKNGQGDNLLWAEVKLLMTRYGRNKNEQKYDRKKLEIATDPKKDFKYEYGCLILLNNSESTTKVEYYRGGDKIVCKEMIDIIKEVR